MSCKEFSKVHCRNLKCLPELAGAGTALTVPQFIIMGMMVCHCASLPKPVMKITYCHHFHIFTGPCIEFLTFLCLKQPVS
jgi:hypothetical protein